MDNLTIHRVDQGSEAWFDLRCGRITGSKFKDLMSAKTTLGYKGLINTCVGEIISQTTDPSYKNDAMQRGTDLEPEARQFYEEIKESEVNEVGFVTNEDIFPEYFGISPDGMVNGGLVEIKCPLMKTHIGYLINGKLPNEYKWQVQGQMLITGSSWCDFMSYYPNIQPMILRVEKDEEMHNQLIERMSDAVVEIKTKVKQLR